MQTTAIQSAETLALLRAVATRDDTLATPCRDSFAKHFLGWKNKILLGCAPHGLQKTLLESVAPGSYAFAIARTRHFDEMLLKALRSGVEQVVILGAGYDSRAMRFESELTGVRVFELDHPGTQARKKALLAKAAKHARSNATFVSVDFAKQSFGHALAANGFRTDLRTIFLWEGVSYYLPKSAVEDVLAFVGSCADGSAIVFDYALSSFVAGDTSTHGGKEIARWLKRIGEPFLFGMSADEAPIVLGACGLRVGSHLGPRDLEQLYLARRDKDDAGKTLGHVRIIEGQSLRSKPSETGGHSS
jgi:methyltransferase (TIGR00027 family)